MIKFGSKLITKKLLPKIVLVLLALWGIIHIVSISHIETKISPQSLQNNICDPTKKFRAAALRSPFNIIASKKYDISRTSLLTSIKRSLNSENYGPSLFNREDRFIKNWLVKNSYKDKVKKCQLLISSMFIEQPFWTNDDIFKSYPNDKEHNLMMDKLGERMRIYNYCFMKNELKMKHVFDGSVFKELGVNAWDYQHRMFPFLEREFVKGEEYMWPTITDLITGAKVEKFNGKFDPNDKHDSFPTALEFNADFFRNWLKYSSGKGIATTMAVSTVDMFAKQLQVFQKLGNTLPVQVITTGMDITPDFVKKLTKAANETGQQVFLVDCSPIFDRTFAKDRIRSFFHKWVAVIMNTFEEAIFIDVDAVPFEKVDSFFNIDGYKDTGLYMYQDRRLVDLKTGQHCADMLQYMAPSIQERYLFGSKLLIDDLLQRNIRSTEAMIHENFFEKLRLHHVDSGLVIINKVKKLTGLLTAFLLQMDAKMQGCIYGDKELFWLGPLFAGENYTIDPFPGGITGSIDLYKVDDSSPNDRHICATQLAHTNANNRLVWTNGGLRTCKFQNTAKGDFGRDESYYKDRYETADNLDRVYGSPLKIDGFIIPDTNVHKWKQLKECNNYMYCAFVTEDDSSENKDTGTIVKFSEEDINMYNAISHKWNKWEI